MPVIVRTGDLSMYVVLGLLLPRGTYVATSYLLRTTVERETSALPKPPQLSLLD